MNKEIQLKQMSLGLQILLFIFPGITGLIGLEYITPYLLERGYPILLLFPLFLWGGIFILFPVIFILYRQEGRQFTWIEFRDRFRLRALQRKDIIWIVSGILIVLFFDFVIGSYLSEKMATIKLFAPPEHFPPLFNPLKEIELPLQNLLGVPLHGNWLFLIVTILLHTFGLITEELLWRGFILPRQEVKWGKYAWIINGLFWAYLTHMVLKWSYLAFLPSMLITPFIAQRTKSTLVSLLVHGIPNTLLWFLILSGIVG